MFFKSSLEMTRRLNPPRCLKKQADDKNLSITFAQSIDRSLAFSIRGSGVETSEVSELFER